jgi:hypothetical protein
MKIRANGFGIWAAALLMTWSAAAQAQLPDCLDKATGQALQVMNQQVLQLKRSTKPQYKTRARISGRIAKITLLRDTHSQFLVQIGQDPQDVVEVVHNVEFGAPSKIDSGQQVEACGDYITVTNSPAGAIVHWTHYNPGDRDGGKHEDGYLQLDGVLYGQERQKQRDNPARDGMRPKLFDLDPMLEPLFDAYARAFAPAG